MRSLADATTIDSVERRSIDYIKTLPKKQDIQSSVGEILLCHGLGDKDMSRLTPDDYGYALEANIELQKIISDISERLIYEDDKRKENNLINFMPKGITWRTFVSNIDGWSVPPNEKHYLIRLSGDPNDPDFVATRDAVRRELSKLSVHVIYHDLYGTRFKSPVRDMGWFGRNL